MIDATQRKVIVGIVIATLVAWAIVTVDLIAIAGAAQRQQVAVRILERERLVVVEEVTDGKSAGERPVEERIGRASRLDRRVACDGSGGWRGRT